MADNTKALKNLTRYSDSMMGIGILLILTMLILPLPSVFIDMFLVFNLGISLIVFLITIYIKEPVSFSIFPTMLLIFTLFRLSLNVACCRAILLRGEDAGSVIKAFGGFVVGGSYVVGIVIFLILIIIQYIVITNGSQRVAEVAARFTLDAMPGKQMAIDADLNSGLINEEQARQRRRRIEEEADFYGAMDGASKFVRGDATAAIIIIIVNILGGFIVGVVQQHMPMVKALQTYILLTIGTGIAMQVSSLLLSTATGIVVSRAATESDLGREFSGQLLSHPRAIGIAAILLFSFVFVPAIPKIPFLLIAGSIGGIAYTVRNALLKSEQDTKKLQEKDALSKKKPENVISMLKMDVLELEVGYGLIPLVNPEQGGSLLERVTLLRRQIALDMGIIVPPIRIRDNVSLAPNEYAIKIRGVDIVHRMVQFNHFLAINPGRVSTHLEGIPTTEPVFNLPAIWITEAQKKRAELVGYTVVDIPSIMATHLSEIIRSHASDILSRQDVQALIDNMKKEHTAVVEELIPNLMNIGEIQKVLQALLRERVSIRDLASVLEVLADNARQTKDPDILAGYVRAVLARQICRQLQNDDKVISVFTLDPHLEQTIIDNTKVQDGKLSYVAIEPETLKKLFSLVTSALEKLSTAQAQPVALVSPAVRVPFRKIVERNFPLLNVLSYNEIPTDQEVRAVERISL